MEIGFPKTSYFFCENLVGNHPPRTVYRAVHADFGGAPGYPLFQLPEGIDGNMVAEQLTNAYVDGHRDRATQIQIALNLR